MPTVKERSVLSGILVREVMRRQVVQLPGGASIGKAVNHIWDQGNGWLALPANQS